MTKDLFRKPLFHILLILVFGIIAYSNTFNSPFHYDDVAAIVKNPMIKDFQFFIEPSRAEAYKNNERSYLVFKQRFFGAFSFAVNYKIHGLDVTGYHIFNLTVHLINALLIYYLVILTFRTGTLQTSVIKDDSKKIAFFAALLFVSHPVQTQAVTYIAQRLASLSTMLYLISLIMYIKARLTSLRYKTLNSINIKALPFFLISLFSTVLAMKTKEIAFTLPLAIAIYEYVFFEGKTKVRLFYLAPLLITMLIIPLSYMNLNQPFDEILDTADKETRIVDNVSRLSYLFTEFRVIVTYIRLLFLPVNQNLDYYYPIYNNFFSLPVLLSFLFLTSILSTAIYLLLRVRRSEHKEHVSYLNLIAFGIFWFFLSLSVESGLIPLKVIFEHRVYLPSVGIAIALSTTLFMIVHHLKEKSKAVSIAVPVILILISLVLVVATYKRNEIWRDEVTLWQDVIGKNPTSVDGHINLGAAYQLKGQLDQAIRHYLLAIKLDPDDAITRYNLGYAYDSKNLLKNAVEQYDYAIKLEPAFSTAYYSLGNVYLKQGLFDDAITQFLSVIRLKPYETNAYYGLALSYLQAKQFDEAIKYFLITLKANTNQPDAQANLGVAYLSKGLVNKAITHLEIASRLDPNSLIARGYLRKAYSMKQQNNTASR